RRCLCVHVLLLLSWSPFFCFCHSDHHQLHSFPTRRSSDLSSRAQFLSAGFSRLCWSARRLQPRAVSTVQGSAHHPSRSRTAVWRSEEHTSELQSREKLVCRLLLEKKKQHPKSSEQLTCRCV